MKYQKEAVVARALPFGIVLLVAALVGSGCQSDGDGAEDGGLRIAASTALIAEFASVVAGADAEVTTLIPAGVDVHSFEPAPATVGAVAEADVIFVNGYNLEEGLLDIVLENVADDAEVVAVAAGLTPLAGGHADDDHEDGEAAGSAADGDVIRADGDPHFWLDVSNAIHYVEQIRDHLIEIDPEGAAGYRERSSAYLAQLEALDAEVAAAIDGIPAGSRKLVVLHDAYHYLADAYGLELAATLLPAGAQQDPSASEVVELINLIEELDVHVIYREPQFSGSVLDGVAEETGATVLVLYSTYADGIESYEQLMRADVRALVEGLGS